MRIPLLVLSIIGFIGWALLAWVLVGLSGIGDGSGLARPMPTSFYLPYAYFAVCIFACFLPRWLSLTIGIGGYICLGSMIYLLIKQGSHWPPIIIACLIIFLLGHGGLWLRVLIGRIKIDKC
jgi:hypothetical protein